MIPDHIRPIVICLFRHGDRILVADSYDSHSQDYFCRPLGGGIEFGESSQQALQREIREELGAEITALQLLGVLENIFTYQGQPGHEVVFVYDAEFSDRRLYDQTELQGYETGEIGAFTATWRSPAEIAAQQIRLVPDCLHDLIRHH